MTLVTLIVLLLKLSIIISVFAIGLKATFADALYLFRRPADVVRVLLAMNVLMPAFALGLLLYSGTGLFWHSLLLRLLV